MLKVCMDSVGRQLRQCDTFGPQIAPEEEYKINQY